MFHASTTLHHRRSENSSFFREKRLIAALPAVMKPDVGLLTKVGGYIGKSARFLWKGVRIPYYMMGGGIINFTAKSIYWAGDQTIEGFKFAGQKVNDFGRWNLGLAKEASLGAAQMAIVGPARFAAGALITAKRSVWDVPIESAKTQLEIVKSPYRFIQGTRDATLGVLGNTGSVVWNTVTGDFDGAIREAKMIPSNLAAPITRPLMPVVKGVRNTVGVALGAYGQNFFDIDGKPSSLKAGFQISKGGYNRLKNSPAAAAEYLRAVRAKEQAEKEAEEADSAAQQQAANQANYQRQRIAANG